MMSSYSPLWYQISLCPRTWLLSLTRSFPNACESNSTFLERKIGTVVMDLCTGTRSGTSLASHRPLWLHLGLAPGLRKILSDFQSPRRLLGRNYRRTRSCNTISSDPLDNVQPNALGNLCPSPLENKFLLRVHANLLLLLLIVVPIVPSISMRIVGGATVKRRLR